MHTPAEAQIQEPIVSPERDQLIIKQSISAARPAYFIDQFLHIDDPNRRNADWFPFRLWPAQRQAIDIIHDEKKLVILKARQLGISWLVLAYSLWLSIFKPGSTTLLFSKSGDDADELMRRVRGMYERLPDWLRPEPEKVLERQLSFKLQNRLSRIKSFNTTKDSGRGQNASLVIVDEAAFIIFLDKLLNAAEPTVDAGGKIIVISTNDKDRPNNPFAELYRRATAGKSDYHPIFMPWYARPDRDQKWYEHKLETKSQDDLWQEYPAVADEALAGRRQTKRFPSRWVSNIRREQTPLTPQGKRSLPHIPHIKYYTQPIKERPYLITVDPAEGDVTSDPSSIAVWDALLWEEVAFVQGSFETSLTASYADRLGIVFNNATICPERNNHGHAILLSLKDVYRYQNIYQSPIDNKPGWYTSVRTKVLAFDKMAELMEVGEIGIRSPEILAQLANIEAKTLEAPEGDHDDAAMVAVLAAAALTWTSKHKQYKRRRVASISY